jgi:hypothetical protein
MTRKNSWADMGRTFDRDIEGPNSFADIGWISETTPVSLPPPLQAAVQNVAQLREVVTEVGAKS